jgi:hypothetical protein
MRAISGIRLPVAIAVLFSAGCDTAGVPGSTKVGAHTPTLTAEEASAVAVELRPVAASTTVIRPAAGGLLANLGVGISQFASRVDEARHRVEFAAANREANFITCSEDVFANFDFGFTISHYSFCQNLFGALREVVKVCRFQIGPICLGSVEREIGRAEFNVTIIGTGWDGTMIDPNDFVDPSKNQIKFVTVLHKFRNVTGTGPGLLLKFDVTCNALSGAAPCEEDPLFQAVPKPVAEWQRDGGQLIRYLHSPLVGSGPDRLSFYDFNYEMTGKQGGASDTVSTAPGGTYRCDAASSPTRGGRGCMFHDTDEIFARLSVDPTTNYFEEVTHIFDVFFRPEVTVPRPPAGVIKDVPGNVFAEFPRFARPLSRLFTPSVADQNHRVAQATCVAEFGAGYTEGGSKECDEFPFRSTFQGAAFAEQPYLYSVRPILASHNASGGGKLGAWYFDRRILEGDRFYVYLNGTSDPGGGGGGFGAPLPDRPPEVSAGPDISGAEGDGLFLAGSAVDAEGPVSVSWSYAPGPDVDPGATCSFGNPTRTMTTITCTDDGTYTVTLTASDGVNAPVSASARVSLVNVAPTATLTAPSPWQVFRVTTAMSLATSISDPGSNDTHVCTIAWDDGTSGSVSAVNGACNATHSFAHAGMYTISVTATDDDGGAGTATVLVVAYDPEAGFVTAGGFIDSPAGALVLDPLLANKGHFNFNPKYRKNDPGPAPSGGKTDFRIDGGDFDVRSTTIEWLVVAPDDKVAVKGTSKAPGRDDLGFVIYGYADDPSRFRIVVWPLALNAFPEDALVYDNRPGASYDLDVADPQPTAGGSIQIHR